MNTVSVVIEVPNATKVGDIVVLKEATAVHAKGDVICIDRLRRRNGRAIIALGANYGKYEAQADVVKQRAVFL